MRRARDLWYLDTDWSIQTTSSSTVTWTYIPQYRNTAYLRQGLKVDLFRMPTVEGDPLSNSAVLRVGKDRWILPHVHGGVTLLAPEFGRTLAHDSGYYNQMAVALVEALIERETHPDIRPAFEIRDKKGVTILSTPNIHWATGFGLEYPNLVSYVIQHTCGQETGSDCNCFIIFSADWVRRT